MLKQSAAYLYMGMLLFPLSVSAADAGDHLNTQITPLPKYLAPGRGKSFQLPPAGQPPAPVPSRPGAGKFRLVRVIFQGNKVFSSDELEAVAASWVGRSVDAADIEELRQKLTRFYIDHGYINSGMLLEKASDGTIVFNVVEGRLTDIHLHGMDRLNDNYVKRRLAKSSDGPLNVNVLRERYQLLLTDPLFSQMNARLMPGSRLGEATLDVDVKRARPYQLTAAVNNYRPPSIGETGLDLSGSICDLTGQGDLLEVSTESSTIKRSDARGSLAWHMPLGYYGTQFFFDIDHGRSSVVEEPVNELNLQRTLDSRDFGLSQVLAETLAKKLTIGVDRVIRENTTTLNGSPYSFMSVPDGVAREKLWRFWGEYVHRSQFQVAALRLTLTHGRNNADNSSPSPTAIPVNKQYSIGLAQLQFARQVTEDGGQFVLRATVQRTRDRLLALDGISIGGVNTVRGYRENQLVRDNGEIYNAEFEYPLVHGPHKSGVTLVPFYDFGRGRDNYAAATAISSYGLAIREQWWGSLKLDIAVAKRLAHPSLPAGNTLQDKGIHFQLSYVY